MVGSKSEEDCMENEMDPSPRMGQTQLVRSLALLLS